MTVPNTRGSAAGAAIVAAIGVGIWWLPGFHSFLLFPPLVLGVGVGFVARYMKARPSVLVITAAVTTAAIFGFFVARVSSFGVHGDALGNVLVVAALIVVEATLAAGAGASLGVMLRYRERGAARNP
jgi:hypothetical protein